MNQWVSEGTCSQVLRSTSVDSRRFERITIFRIKIDWNYNFEGLLHHPFWLQLVLALSANHFQLLKPLCLVKDHWWGFINRNANMVYIVSLIPFKARCWKPPGHYLCIPEPGRPDCVISIHIGVNGDAYPVAISPKVTKNLPVSFYSPTSGFKMVYTS